MAGGYDSRTDFEKLNNELLSHEKDGAANRIFYLALPPSVFQPVTVHIRNACMAEKYIFILQNLPSYIIK